MKNTSGTGGNGQEGRVEITDVIIVPTHGVTPENMLEKLRESIRRHELVDFNSPPTASGDHHGP